MTKKEGEIKNIEKDGIRMVHLRYANGLGLLMDSFNLIDERSKPLKKHFPFIGKMKVRTLTKDDDILDTTTDYSDKEYMEMMDEQIKYFEL